MFGMTAKQWREANRDLFYSNKNANNMIVKGIIERSESGRYYIYIPADKNPFRRVAVLGEGDTQEEAKTDFKNVLYDFVEQGLVERQDFEFEFQIDVLSFLESFKSLFTMSGLARLTGIHAAQLSHYITGRSKPSLKTQAKIQDALANLAAELAQVKSTV
jgi:DNA-binding phage protein